MKSNTGDKTEGSYTKEKDKYNKIVVEQIDKTKLESEGTCETIIGKEEKEVCNVKT